MGKILNLGDVIELDKLDGQYVVIAADIGGGGPGHGSHDVYPDAAEIKARRMQRSPYVGEKYHYDPDGVDVKFTQFDQAGASSRSNVIRHRLIGQLDRSEMLTISDNVRGYVVVLDSEGQARKYIHRGEYERFSFRESFSGCEMFPSMAAAQAVFSDSGFTRRNTYSDGSTTPPSLLWSGLGINNARPRAEGMVRIMGVRLEDKYTRVVSDAITPRKEEEPDSELDQLRAQVRSLGGSPVA